VHGFFPFALLILDFERVVMYKDSALATDRRVFLRVGLIAGLGCVVGCGGEDEPSVMTPTLEKGNRKRLDGIIKKAPEAPAKKK
jgi:hypothetical protein